MTEGGSSTEQTPNENTKTAQKDNTIDVFANQIIDFLILSKDAHFKSQQRDEKELTMEEKREIAFGILSSSKANFLSRFGTQLKEEHLEYFSKYITDENEAYDIKFYLSNLKRHFSKTKRNKDIRNRRYGALNKLVQDNTYFTELEMMRRNPLLYDHLVGQYMSEDEKKKRDNIDTTNITFVNLLLEGIDRETTRNKQKEQQEYEDEVMEEEDDDSSQSETESENKPNKKINGVNLVTSDDDEDRIVLPKTRWGEFEGSEDRNKPNISWARPQMQPQREVVMITAAERRLFKEEFISIMYQNFIDGKDTDFDYSVVDNNDEFDNIEIKNLDAEEKYFDSESPEDVPIEDVKMADGSTETSEDELDIFMTRLSQHHSLIQLSNDMSHL